MMDLRLGENDVVSMLRKASRQDAMSSKLWLVNEQVNIIHRLGHQAIVRKTSKSAMA